MINYHDPWGCFSHQTSWYELDSLGERWHTGQQWKSFIIIIAIKSVGGLNSWFYCCTSPTLMQLNSRQRDSRRAFPVQRTTNPINPRAHLRKTARFPEGPLTRTGMTMNSLQHNSWALQREKLTLCTFLDVKKRHFVSKTPEYHTAGRCEGDSRRREANVDQVVNRWRAEGLDAAPTWWEWLHANRHLLNAATFTMCQWLAWFHSASRKLAGSSKLTRSWWEIGC